MCNLKISSSHSKKGILKSEMIHFTNPVYPEYYHVSMSSIWKLLIRYFTFFFYILNLQNSICILNSQQFRLATFQVFNNRMWQLTTLDRAVLRNTTGFPKWLCQFIFLRVVYEHHSCPTSSSELGAYPYFNAAAVLYLFPTTNLNLIIIVILDTMSLL